MLEVEELVVQYGRITAVDQVSYTVTPGEVTLVLGPNGAGKTSTLLAVAGVLRPRSGRISLEGTDITRMAAHRRVGQGLVLVPEGRRIFGGLSVIENLRMGAMAAAPGERNAVTDQIFELFPILSERASRRAGLLSGGEQQMLAIGRALMSRPKYVLMDEPSMGLAPTVVDVVLDSVRKIADTGVGVLMVEQNAEAGAEIADSVSVMSRGRVVHAGPIGSTASDYEMLRAILGESAVAG